MHQADDISSPLHRLAHAAGLAVSWVDVHGQTHIVSDTTLEALLDAMGLACTNSVRIECSLRQLHEEASHTDRRMIVAEVDEPILFSHDGPLRYQLQYESGVGGREGEAQIAKPGWVRLEPVNVTGYHSLSIGGHRLILAVAPHRCVAPLHGSDKRGLWGISAQVYSLRPSRSPDCEPIPNAVHGAGHYGALAELARLAGEQDADALLISPVHALFSADASRYSPYAPSSRLFLNTAYIDVAAFEENVLRAALASLPDNLRDPAMAQPERDDSLIDWPAVQHARLALAQQLFVHFETQSTPAARQAFDAFWKAGGEALQNHCLYEALHEHYAPTLGAGSGWQDWPAPMRDPSAAAAQAFARQYGQRLRFHAFLQWLADEGMRTAQKKARAAGMSIGLITDLAIGADARGSQAWSSQHSFLQGASVGAAPDLHHAQGQNWGLTAFSPRALHATGFGPFLDILRCALAHSGGVRIDHVLGLARMWLVPDGMTADQGAFLRYPLNDLLRLLALESERHQAIVVGENLGTVPSGFNAQLSEKGVLGTSVLWFEREEPAPQRFVPVQNWPSNFVATTTTHDLPTVAGWWQGTDLDWLTRLGRIKPDTLQAEHAQRQQDKRLLMQAIARDTAVESPPPVADVLSWVASSSASLCVFPLEDILALPEQPNLPGPCAKDGPAHPNWLRRLPVSVDSLFSDPAAKQTIPAICRARSKS